MLITIFAVVVLIAIIIGLILMAHDDAEVQDITDPSSELFPTHPVLGNHLELSPEKSESQRDQRTGSPGDVP